MNKKIGEFIADLRKEKGMTQQEFGDKLFVTDKAVSKWERGLSLPDLSVLKDLAKTLDVEIEDILSGERNSKKISVENQVNKIRKEIEETNKKKKKNTIILITILSLSIIYVLITHISFGYTEKQLLFEHNDSKITLGIPRFSINIKNNDRSYSMKSLRSKIVLENEIKKYLNTLEYSSCNNTVYYHNKKDNYSIIDYSVKNHIIYNTISYEVVKGDYCKTKSYNEYQEKLGYIGLFQYGITEVRKDLKEDEGLSFVLIQGFDESLDHPFTAYVQINYVKDIQDFLNRKKEQMTVELLEESRGYFEIKEDKLYYYRTEIKEKGNKINIPEVSVFEIKYNKLILLENYLQKYASNIALERP
mgnify:CR=1 FL=1